MLKPCPTLLSYAFACFRKTFLFFFLPFTSPVTRVAFSYFDNSHVAMESSSTSSTLSNPPSYPGLHSVALLQPKSPGCHSAREDADTWYAWREEIRDLVDFLLTETPPAPAASPKRSSRELLRSGSKHLRQSLRGRPLRNTWGSRQLRTLMGKPEQRFCHIVQDPEFLKDMSDPGMYLINCNARALGRGR